MPIPFFLIALGVGTAALGAGKTIKAGIDIKDAKETNEYAQSIVNRANDEAKFSRENCNNAIVELGRKKLWVLNNSVNSFIATFETIHNIELIESDGIDELQKININERSFKELKEMGITASSILGGVAGGAVGGALTAIGAYGAATTFGACATTGTAIASLSGAAATNATLAFLGGGALSIGGLGVAGGTAVLGGLVAGPALTIMGFIVGAKASANKDEAYSNLAKAREFEETVKTVKVLCKGIRMRANMFERLLIKLDCIFSPLVSELNKIITVSGTNYNDYTTDEKAVVAKCLSLITAIKMVLDTPILTEDGALTDESIEVYNCIQNKTSN